MNGPAEPIDQDLARFVDAHVRSLISWEILVFFDSHRNAVLDEKTLAERLGRRPEDIRADVDALCRTGALSCGGGLIKFAADPDVAAMVTQFVSACTHVRSRRALLGRILPRIDAAYRLRAQPPAQ